MLSGGSVLCTHCRLPANQSCKRVSCKSCCIAASERAEASGMPAPRCAPHSIRSNTKTARTASASRPPASQPSLGPYVTPPTSLEHDSSSHPGTGSASSQSGASALDSSEHHVQLGITSPSSLPTGTAASSSSQETSAGPDPTSLTTTRSSEPSPHIRGQYAQPVRLWKDMPLDWLSARQQVHSKWQSEGVQRKENLQEAQQQRQRSLSLLCWTKRDTEAVELSPVVVHTYPAFRIADHDDIFQLLCPLQSVDKAYVQVYDPRKNRWPVSSATSYRDIATNETTLLLRKIASLSESAFDTAGYPGMESAMQSLCKKRTVGSLDDPAVPFAPVAKRPRLASMSDPLLFPTVRPHTHSSPGPEPAARHNRHICTRVAMADWRAHSSPSAEPDSSCDRTLPAVDEEPEDDELSAAHTTPVAPLVPVPSEPPVTRTPGKSSHSVSDEPLQTIPRGFQVRRYLNANVSFPKSLPFESIYNGLIKVNTMLSQRNPPIKREDACAAVWPAYEWKGKRAKGVDDARNDLGRGDADLWQRCLNTEEALWGDYTRYLTELGRSTSKSLRFPWDKDAGRLSPLASIPQASEPSVTPQAHVAHSLPHLDIVPQAHEPHSMPITEMDQPSSRSVDPRASAAPEPLPSEPAITAAESPPSGTASPALPLPPLGDIAAHASEHRSGPEAANGPESLPAGVPQASDPAVAAQASEAMLAQEAISFAAICSPRAANAQLLVSDLSLLSDTNIYPTYNPTPPSYRPESPELPSWLADAWNRQTFGLEQGVAGMTTFSTDFAQSVPSGSVEALFRNDNAGQSAVNDYTGSE
ncbi:uncharacterized protein C8Q71DRAFT_281576 [Rhodofomes roseus]|uniref:Uncharacterized protein n=1 Tax=Rhodofomes roseus TaxID=34475 RepID=A0ABQ8K576_9APHY|nr:uncharacterized protein C8Q71DRAFT_281576 [Rhodofomes roseus]KAH9832094.1 hypothetical protein C8Q71DRAFT_281576 [Rhodofomes roseus]